MTYSSTIIYISVWLLMTLAFQTVAQENLIPQGPMGTVSYSLVGSVSRVSANVAIEESTVAECGRKCAFRKAIEPQCIGFSWLPKVKLEETALTGSVKGECRLLECIPERAIQKGSARLYLRVLNSRSPHYGVLWSVPDGYVNVCTFAFRAYKKKLNFTDAAEACRKEGGRLLYTRTPEQHLEVNAKLLRSTPHWVGLADIYGNRTFQFLDGTNIGEKKEWGKNQPNNYIGGKREPQSCVMLHNGVWNDEQCSSQHSYICQIPFVDM